MTTETHVLEALSENEKYLWAILQDPSGVDHAEFLWYEPDEDDFCFRAWPFQWGWWRDDAPLQIDQCARSVGKTLSIQARMFAFPFLFPGQEAVVTAPELVHLEPLTQLIEQRFETCRLGREIRPRGRSAVTHRPFMMIFANGSRIIGRIPQRDGKGVKGIHPIRLELDEAQDYPTRGWTELNETLKRGVEGCQWRAHGVTRGLRDKFFEYTNEMDPDNHWRVHRLTAMHRPNWTDQERQEKIQQYGGNRDDPDYRRNVLGLHGDATNALFVLHRLMRCVDVDESSDYNLDEYHHQTITTEQFEDAVGKGSATSIVDLLEFRERHQRYPVIWAGMDVGFTADPSEILIFAEYMPETPELKADKGANRAVPEDGTSRVKLIARYTLKRMSSPEQMRAIFAIFDFYQPRGYAMDKTGNGLPLYQACLEELERAEARGEMHAAEARRLRSVAERFKGYNFSEKVIVDIDNTVELDPYHPDPEKEAGINQNVLEYSTDALRKFVDQGRLLLPFDGPLIKEYQGQTFEYSKAPIDSYGRRRRVFSEGRFHALDASRMAIMALVQAPIEEFLKKPKQGGPVLDSFVSA